MSEVKACEILVSDILLISRAECMPSCSAPDDLLSNLDRLPMWDHLVSILV